MNNAIIPGFARPCKNYFPFLTPDSLPSVAPRDGVVRFEFGGYR